MIQKIIERFSSLNLLFCLGATLFIIFVFKNPEIILTLFVSLVIACSLNPLVDKLEKKFNRTLSSAIVLFGTVAAIFLLLLPVVCLAAYQISAFCEDFPNYVDSLDDSKYFAPLVAKLGATNIDWQNTMSTIASYTTNFLDNIVSIAQSLGSAIVYFALSIIFIFYFMADKDSIKNTAIRFFPIKLRKKAEEILDIIGEKIGGYIIAQSCAIISVAIVMTLGLFIFNVKYSIILGLITAILDIIPVVGPACALLICWVTTYQSGIAAIIIVTIVFAIAQLVENNVVRPYVFGKLLNLHPMIIFFFLFIATKYLGIIGTLFAPAIAATICVLIEELYLKQMDK